MAKIEVELDDRLLKKLDSIVEHCRHNSCKPDGIAYSENINRQDVIKTLIDCIELSPYIAQAVREQLPQKKPETSSGSSGENSN